MDVLNDLAFLFPAFRFIWVLFIILDVVFLVLFLFSLSRIWPYRPKLHPERETHQVKKIPTLGDTIIKERWATVAKKYASGRPDELKVAIIEADKIADDILKKLGLEGEHMADRLKQVKPQELKTLDRLWRAHRLRNELVHTPGFELTPEAAKGALDDYDAFLNELGALS